MLILLYISSDNATETCVVLRAIGSRNLGHLGLQLLETWSVLPR